jgi:hypothetical protein
MRKPLDWVGIWGDNIEILSLEDIENLKIEFWNWTLRGPVPFRTPQRPVGGMQLPNLPLAKEGLGHRLPRVVSYQT